MKKYIENTAKSLMGVSYKELDDSEKEVIESIADGESIVEDVNQTFNEQLKFGQRLADKISEFGGSWTFIILFLLVLMSWMVLNSYYLAAEAKAFDPFPYILLNLVLSTIAALQAPVIMMSQNRQSAKDRLDITENYKVSLKTDLEIMLLHKKLDELTQLIEQQSGASGK
jgi:uncharacterized membrane protein